MSPISPGNHVTLALGEFLGLTGSDTSSGKLVLERLPSSRPVWRGTGLAGRGAVVGKFYDGYPAQSTQDRSLEKEYRNYLWAAELGFNREPRLIPRLLGRRPQLRLGLLLEAIPGPDLDRLLKQACEAGELPPLLHGLEKLAKLLAFFHSQPLPPVEDQESSPWEALAYLDKLIRQLKALGLLPPEDEGLLQDERRAWEAILLSLRRQDRRVLIHGDATPTNFLFPDGRAVALDLERLRVGDRLWDLSWVAGEVKHAWGWRRHDLGGGEEAIGHFFRSYLAALKAPPALARRVYGLNSFYMALTELRIARNAYLSWDYRRALVAQAGQCLSHGRRNL
jgi:aminoglycoside phosphotransferase